MFWFISTMSALFVLAVCGLIALGSSSVSGKEFSPTHFQSRNFSFSRLPLLNIQISGIRHTPYPSSTGLYLVAQNLIQVPSGPPKRWDLARMHRAGYSNSLGDCSVLTAYLESTGGSGLDWKKWSQDNPAAAKVLWPVVQDLAIHQLYLMIPRIFELAENQSDAQQLRQELTDYISSDLPSFAEDLAAAGRQSDAVGALQWGQKKYPNVPAIAAALAKLSSGSVSAPSNP